MESEVVVVMILELFISEPRLTFEEAAVPSTLHTKMNELAREII